MYLLICRNNLKIFKSCSRRAIFPLKLDFDNGNIFGQTVNMPP